MEFKFAARTSSPASVQRSFKFASRTTSSSPVPDSSRHVREQWTRSLPLGLSRLCLTALVMRVNDGVCLSDSTHANFRYQEALDCANGPSAGAQTEPIIVIIIYLYSLNLLLSSNRPTHWALGALGAGHDDRRTGRTASGTSQFALSTDVLWLSNEQYLALVVLVVLSKNESHEVLCIFASFGALFRCCRCHVTKVQFHPAYYNLWSECG